MMQGGKVRSAAPRKPGDQFAFERKKIGEESLPMPVIQGKAALKTKGGSKRSLDLRAGRQGASLSQPWGRRRTVVPSLVTQTGQAAAEGGGSLASDRLALKA